MHLGNANFCKPKFLSCILSLRMFSRIPKIMILKPRIVIDKPKIMINNPWFIVFKTMVLTFLTLVYRIIVHLACHSPSNVELKQMAGTK